MRLTLPPLFDAFGGQPPSGGVVALSDNTTNGLVLDHLDVSLPEADIELSFRQMSFVYSAHGNVDPPCGRDWWKANGEISLGIGNSDPTPPASEPTRCDFALEDSRSERGRRSASATRSTRPKCFSSA